MGNSTQIRGLTRRWAPRRPEADRPDPSVPLVDRVLAARGVTPDAADAFLAPSLMAMHEPGLIPDMDKAAARLLDAARRGERIVIYGDYDVDGVTASAILVRMLRLLAPGAPVATYIPHRIDEGYGINTAAIERLAAEGARVIVSVDCGITAVEPARAARALGVDLIITDHHNPPASMEELPDAFAVVHPRRPDSAYPFGELCGAGVAYKLAWRLATLDAGDRRVSAVCRGVLVELLGLAALGSIADLVPLVDENRVIVRHGLNRLGRGGCEGLDALIHACRLDSDKVDCDAVGFRLAPRLNAVGRLGHAREALELLTDARGARATQLAEVLGRVNDERRAVERAIFERACEMAEAAGMTGPDRRAIVLADPGWHPGVVGIVCSRLVERYARPALLLQRDGGVCKGSGRSVDGFNLHAGLAACADLLSRFGGHDMAAGLACDADRFEAFAERFIEHANARLSPENMVHTLRYDAVAGVADLTRPAVEQLEKLAPFGRGNPRVRIRVRGRLNGSPEPLGSTGAHLALRLMGEDARGEAVRVVAWNFAAHAPAIPPGCRVEAVVEPKLSRWNGVARVEPVLADLRVLGAGEPPAVHSVGAVAYEPVRS